MVLLAVVFVAGGVRSASAESGYPSWADVEASRASEAAVQAQVGELETLIAGLSAEVVASRELAATRATEYERAQAAFDVATYRATELNAQAEAAGGRAERSARQAGQLAAMLARTGATNLTATLLFNTDNADALLARLGSMSKLTEQTTRVYQQATSDRNTAAALTKQATHARDLLGDLAHDAEVALDAAIAAHAAAEIALAEQQQHVARIQAQLAVLAENREATEADYEKGEAARRAAEASGNRGGAGPAGPVNERGWTRPVSGWITDRFGPRPNKPVEGVNPFHAGTDIAAGCGTPVYAATSGTVVYADRLGTYGLWVLIDHGDGIQTGYAHNGQLHVNPGRWVPAGAHIAAVGSTGASTGCHLHYEVREHGARIDPEPFMTTRGIQLG